MACFMKKAIILLLLALFLFSCEEKRDEDNLNIALSQDIDSLDVMKSTNRSLRDILIGSVYERLFVLDNGKIENELAESYEFSDDGHTLKIRIRKNVFMHDGSYMTGEDVAASLNRFIECSEEAGLLAGPARFMETEDGVEITSENKLYLLIYLLSSGAQSAVIARASSLEENEYGLVTRIVGTGPYVLSSFSPGVRVVLERFDAYSSYGEESAGIAGKKHAYFKRITFNIVADAAARRIALEKGQYDYINDVMSYDIPSLSKNKDIKLIGGKESGSVAIVFNKRSELAKNADFRRSVAYALDYEALMKACYGKEGFSVHSDYMEEGQGFSVEGDPYSERNVEKAKESLAKSPYDGRPFRILTSNLSNLEKIAVAAESMLREAGIKTEIIAQDWVGFLNRRNNEEDYDAFISAFSSVPLPSMKLYLSSSYPGWYESEEKEMILSSLRSAESIEQAQELWQDAQRFFWSDVPVIILGHYSTISAHSATITGIIEGEGFHFWNAKRREST